MLVEVVLVDVVVVVVPQPLHVLAHDSKNGSQRSAANTSWHLAKGKVFAIPSHLYNVEEVVEVLVSQPLQVCSHLPGTIEHKPCDKIV